MKKFIAALFCLVLMVGSVSCIPQTSLTRRQIIVPEGHGDYSLPPIDFGLKDVVDVLTEYKIREENQSWACNYQVFAYTDFRTKTITICGGYDLADRRESVIHEILHVLYHYRGIDTSGYYEHAIGLRSKEIFKQLYGFPTEPARSTPAPKISEEALPPSDSTADPAATPSDQK
jgi:hypothetical protein